MPRRDKSNYYLDIAQSVALRVTCIRHNFGCIIVKNDEIISTGYSGAPRGRQNCSDLGECMRKKLNIPKGERYELCRSVHSEANAIISAARRDMIGGSLYLACVNSDGGLIPETNSCAMCKKLIINSGIKEVIIRDDYDHYRVVLVQDWIDDDESLKGILGY